MQDHRGFGFGDADIRAEWYVVRLGEPLPALLAFVALEIVAAFTGLHHFGSAIVAGHCEISY